LKTSQAIKQALEDVTSMQAKIDAAQKVLNDPYAMALGKLSLMFEYARRDLEIQLLRSTNASQQDIRARATELLDWIKTHANDGVFLVKDQRLAQNRVNSRYGLGKGG
jgi:hypothetical protein